MVSYTCDRCQTVYTHKSKYDNHINRLYRCKIVVPPPAIDYPKIVQELRDEINLLRRDRDETTKGHEDEANLLKYINDEIIKRHVEEIAQTKINHACDIEKLKQEYESQIFILSNEKNRRDVVSKIQNYGNQIYKDNLDDRLNYFFKDISKCICNIVKHVHFSDKLELRNIYIDDKKERDFIRRFHNGKWIIEEQRSFLNNLIKFVIIDIEELSDDLSKSSKKRFVKFLNEHQQDEQLMKETYEKVRDIIIDGSFDGDNLFWIYQEKYTT